MVVPGCGGGTRLLGCGKKLLVILLEVTVASVLELVLVVCGTRGTSANGAVVVVIIGIGIL